MTDLAATDLRTIYIDTFQNILNSSGHVQLIFFVSGIDDTSYPQRTTCKRPLN